jgi:hypothetical protein
METMVEQVAKALYEADPCMDMKRGAIAWKALSDDEWGGELMDDFRKTARIAIAAMREPTPEMQMQYPDGDDGEPTGFHPNCQMCGGHLEGWKIMIDLALKQ